MVALPLPKLDYTHVRWTGASGQFYEFQLLPIGTVYHSRSGVYIFCRLALDGNWSAVYIGETANFNRRLTTELALHHKWHCINQNGATHICTMHVPGNLARREDIETDLRRQILTPCNDQ